MKRQIDPLRDHCQTHGAAALVRRKDENKFHSVEDAQLCVCDAQRRQREMQPPQFIAGIGGLRSTHYNLTLGQKNQDTALPSANSQVGTRGRWEIRVGVVRAFGEGRT